jgi:hypothetical protein
LPSSAASVPFIPRKKIAVFFNLETILCVNWVFYGTIFILNVERFTNPRTNHSCSNLKRFSLSKAESHRAMSQKFVVFLKILTQQNRFT